MYIYRQIFTDIYIYTYIYIHIIYIYIYIYILYTLLPARRTPRRRHAHAGGLFVVQGVENVVLGMAHLGRLYVYIYIYMYIYIIHISTNQRGVPLAPTLSVCLLCRAWRTWCLAWRTAAG